MLAGARTLHDLTSMPRVGTPDHVADPVAQHIPQYELWKIRSDHHSRRQRDALTNANGLYDFAARGIGQNEFGQRGLTRARTRAQPTALLPLLQYFGLGVLLRGDHSVVIVDDLVGWAFA